MKNMRALDFECVLIPGIDSKLISNLEATKIVSQKAARIVLGREISIGEACCSLVHLQAYTDFVHSENEWVLILEDDAVLLDEKIKEFDFSLKISTPTILKVSSPTHEDSYIDTLRHADDILVSAAGFKRLRFPTSMAHSYLINRSAAKIAVANTPREKIHFTADWPYLWDAEVSFWQSESDFFVQVGDSLIDSEQSRAEIISNSLPLRSHKLRVSENLRDLSFFNSTLLFLYGGNGSSYYKSRCIKKVLDWLFRFRDFWMKHRYPI